MAAQSQSLGGQEKLAKWLNFNANTEYNGSIEYLYLIREKTQISCETLNPYQREKDQDNNQYEAVSKEIQQKEVE